MQNQDVKSIQPEDFVVEQKKRGDRRVEIERPKRSVQFVLEENKTKEFRISDIVQSDERVIKSSERNEPSTEGRLVKLKPNVEQQPEENELVQDAEEGGHQTAQNIDSSTNNDDATNNTRETTTTSSSSNLTNQDTNTAPSSLSPS